jgi:hypothetical protein
MEVLPGNANKQISSGNGAPNSNHISKFPRAFWGCPARIGISIFEALTRGSFSKPDRLDEHGMYRNGQLHIPFAVRLVLQAVTCTPFLSS